MPHTVQHWPIFQDVEPAAFERLQSAGRTARFGRGETILQVFDPSPRLLFMLDGFANLCGEASNGRRRVIYVYRTGDIIGSRFLLEDSGESRYPVYALSDVRAFVVTRDRLLAIGRDHPRFLLAVTESLTRRLARLQERALSAMSLEVGVRLAQVLLDFADGQGAAPDEYVPLTARITHETLAQIVGSSRPHTSTLISDCERLGLLRRVGHEIHVRKDRLRDVVQRGTLTESA